MLIGMTSGQVRMQPSPTVSLAEVQQLALPPGSSLLCGDEQLRRRIRWARLVRARPSSLSGVEADEMLLLTRPLLDSLSEPRTLKRLLSDLIEAGVAAFALAGDDTGPVLEVCAERGTPLFQLPTDALLAEAERAIVTLILDRDSQLRRRADEVYDRLLASMLSNAGLSALVQALAEATGLRAAVFDDYFSLQACAPEEERFRQTVAEGIGSLLLHEAASGLSRLGRVLPVRLEQDGVAWIGQLHPLEIGSAWAGYLGLLGRPGESGELDFLLADRAATLVALELAKQRAVASATQRWRGEFLDDLLDGNFPTEEALLARGHQLGYDLTGPHLTFILQADAEPEPVKPGEGGLAAARRRRRFVEVARGALSRLEPRALAVDREGGLIGLLPAAGLEDSDQATALVERIRSSLEETRAGLGVTAGIGRLVYQPRQFPIALEEAQQALGIGQRLLGGGRTVHFARLGVERLLYHLLGHPALERFARDVLGDLMTYDAEHRADLVRTVEVFLACNGNHVRAAQELHLHRNTLLYRLERAREVLGGDLEDADTRLALQVALRLRGAAGVRPHEQDRGPRRVAARRRRAG
jgi:purine catabolism regulator